MFIILLIGLVLVVVSVALVLRAVNMSRARSAEMVETIDPYGFSGRTESVLVRSGDSTRGTVDDLVSRIGGFVYGSDRQRSTASACASSSSLPACTRRHRASLRGTGLSRRSAVPALAIWASVSGLSGLLVVLGCVFAVVVGLIGPIRIVLARAKRRQPEIDYQLPDLIDLLVVTVEAGVGFTGSLRVAGERVEAARWDRSYGSRCRSRDGAFDERGAHQMLERVETPGMRSFVRSVLQGETLGVSIGQIMRNLAVEMRKRRRALAEERAQKAPIKILFPLDLHDLSRDIRDHPRACHLRAHGRAAQMSRANLQKMVLRGADGRIVCASCEVADGLVSRAKGLLGRSELPSAKVS